MRINPIYKNELKLMSRRMRSFVIIIVYNVFIAVVGIALLNIFAGNIRTAGNASYAALSNMYRLMLLMEFFIMCVCVPVISSGAIAGEREHQTLDVLLVSLLPNTRIIFGKLASCVSMSILLLISGAPMSGFVFLFGGIHVTELLFVTLYMIFMVVLLGAVGVYWSARLKQSLHATVGSYVTLAVLIGGTALPVFINGYFLGSHKLPVLLGEAGNLLLLFNPLATLYAIISNQLSHHAIGAAYLFNDKDLSMYPGWTAMSIAAQGLMLIVFVMLAVRSLSAQKEHYRKDKNIK